MDDENESLGDDFRVNNDDLDEGEIEPIEPLEDLGLDEEDPEKDS